MCIGMKLAGLVRQMLADAEQQHVGNLPVLDSICRSASLAGMKPAPHRDRGSRIVLV
jgi:hypothetical protein